MVFSGWEEAGDWVGVARMGKLVTSGVGESLGMVGDLASQFAAYVEAFAGPVSCDSDVVLR